MKQGTFTSSFTVIEVIKCRKGKKTSIVSDEKGQHFIAKKLSVLDQQTLNEINTMRKIRHPNLISLHDSIIEKDHVYMIEEYCEEGDLAFHIRRQVRKHKTYFSEQIVGKWMLQLLMAVEYLHSHKIMHRDIRPQNVFLTAEGNLKLGSFRSSKMFEGDRSLAITNLGSPYYLAPECLQNDVYDQKVDIWAYGCVLYELCYLSPIFHSQSLLHAAHKVLKGESNELPRTFSKELNQIFLKCMTEKSTERPSAQQLLKLPYFLKMIQIFISKRCLAGLYSRVPIKLYKIHNKNFTKARLCRQGNAKPKHLDLVDRAQRGDPSRPNGGNSQLPKVPMNPNYERKKSVDKKREGGSTSSTMLVSRQIGKISQEILRCKAGAKSQQKKSIEVSSQKTPRGPRQSSLTHEIANKSQEKGQEHKNSKLLTPPQNQNNLSAPPRLPRLHKRPPKKPKDSPNPQKSQLISPGVSIFQSDELKRETKAKNIAEESSKIKDSLVTMLDELDIQQVDLQELSFELEDEDQVRLTIKESDEKELLKMYETKLQQIIEEINYKYCPDLETIQQKTTEFDSNTFSYIRNQ